MGAPNHVNVPDFTNHGTWP